jgi:hypothetical protein
VSGARLSAGTEDELAAQLRVLRALHRTGAVPAPAALRARIELARVPAGSTRRRSSTRWTVSLAGAAAACALLAAGLVLGTQGPGGPSVADAAVLGVRPPQVQVLEPRGEPLWLPRVTAAGLSYPYWEDRFGYRAVGLRRDRLGGRQATTVLYVRGRRRLAYTIISGTPLRAGARIRSASSAGVRMDSLAAYGEVVVTWLRHGHTCVLAGRGTPLSLMARLAAASTDG